VTWVKLDTAILTNGVWTNGLDFRIWVWLLCRAQTSSTPGVVRFPYTVVARQIAWMDGTKLRKPDRKTIRRALQRMDSDGRLTVDEWVQGSPAAVTQGGAQGYITVRLTNWPLWGRCSTDAPQGVAPGVAPGVAAQRSITRPTKKREREKDRRHTSPSGDPACESNGKDGEPWGPFMGPGEALTPQGIAYLWNSVAKQYGAPRVSTFPDRRRRKAKVALGEEADPKVWAAAFHAMCQDPFLAGKNDRDRVYATFDYAMSGKRDQWMDGARNSDEEVIP